MPDNQEYFGIRLGTVVQTQACKELPTNTQEPDKCASRHRLSFVWPKILLRCIEIAFLRPKITSFLASARVQDPRERSIVPPKGPGTGVTVVHIGTLHQNDPKWPKMTQNGQKSVKKGGTPLFDHFSVRYQPPRSCCRRFWKKSAVFPPGGPSAGGKNRTFFQEDRKSVG